MSESHLRSWRGPWSLGYPRGRDVPAQAEGPPLAHNRQRDLWSTATVPFHDKAFRRALLPAWDERWHRLSRPARALLLAASEGLSVYRDSQGVVARGPREPLEELAREGFVRPPEGGTAALREDARDFCLRLALLRQ